jgi:OOP family OmpA-OmpF porin
MRLKLVRGFCLTFSLINLVGCTNIETLKRVTPKGNDFQKSLTNYYRGFAEHEAILCDWSDSQHFINKAMIAAYGNTPLPENLIYWKISPTKIIELDSARKKLIDLLFNHKMIQHQPQLAAKAQFSFDCWVEEQEEEWQPDAIDSCRENFYQSIHELATISEVSIKSKYTPKKKPDAKKISKSRRKKIKDNKPSTEVLKITEQPNHAQLKIVDLDKPHQIKVIKPKEIKIDKPKSAKSLLNNNVKEDKNKDDNSVFKPIEIEQKKLDKPQNEIKLNLSEKIIKDYNFKQSSLKRSLADDTIKQLEIFAKNFKDKAYEINITSFSSKLVNENQNLKQAKNWATRIKDVLINNGIDSKNITIFAYAEKNNSSKIIKDANAKLIDIVISD